MKTFVLIIFCIGISTQTFSSQVVWYQQPPYRYYYKKQREYQRYQYNLQKQRNQQNTAETQDPKSDLEENPNTTNSVLTPASLKLERIDYEYVIRMKDLNEKKADPQ